MAETLNPCPFCGGEAELVTGTHRDGGYVENCAYVRCKRCGARTYEFHECMTAEKVQRYAAEVWNERAERTCRAVRSGEPSPTGVPRERRCSECGGRLTRFGAYCHNCGVRVASE